MSTHDLTILVFILSAFVVFAATLGWLSRR